MAHQSLYRRFRPQRFSDVRGQDHLVAALRSAVIEDRLGHAYLFSGPRGTGKTTTARILAKVLNCQDVVDGEPCGVCSSCEAIESGTSFDLKELDAASNRGIGEMRDLLETVHLGTPGRNKVYILDEVHMLTKEASAALLKSLEEPPGHVVFVLATTDPEKVLPTIRSRTQHYKLDLLSSTTLRELVDEVARSAELVLTDEQAEVAVRRGRGSARDTLSALEQVVASGDVRDLEGFGALLAGLAASDVGMVLASVQEAVNTGREPRFIAESLVERFRNSFLVSIGVEVVHLSDQELNEARETSETLSPRLLTQAMEGLGTAIVEMRHAPDPRIPLEVALARLCRSESSSQQDRGDAVPTDLLTRIQELERRVVALESDRVGSSTPPSAPPASTPPISAKSNATPANHVAEPPVDHPAADLPPVPDGPKPDPNLSGPAQARAALARSNELAGEPPKVAVAEPAKKLSATPTGSALPTTPTDSVPLTTTVQAAPAPATEDPALPGSTVAELPSRDALTLAWADTILGQLSKAARTRWTAGRFLRVDDAAVYGLPNEITVSRCGDYRAEVESALAQHFGRAVPVRLVVDDESRPPDDALSPAESLRQELDELDDDDANIGPVDELENADNAVGDVVGKLTQAFPGSQLEINEQGDDQ